MPAGVEHRDGRILRRLGATSVTASRFTRPLRWTASRISVPAARFDTAAMNALTFSISIPSSETSTSPGSNPAVSAGRP